MDHCVGCGHALEHSRFCTQCGRPCDSDDWRTGTAERPVVPPIPEADPLPVPVAQPAPTHPPPSAPPPRRATLPPPVVSAPPAARYPLFADEAEGLVGDATSAAPLLPVSPAPATSGPSAASASASSPAAGVPTYAGPPGRPSRGWLPWLIGVLALALVAVVGVLLIVGGDDDASTDRASDPGSASTPADTASTPSDDPGGSRSASPDPTPSKPPKRSRPAQVTRSLTVEVPATAAPNQDVSGNLVRYEATNMIDGVPTTCWRMPGSGAGEEVVLRLAEPTKVAQVGMINGYAKTSGDLDWYTGNRRVLAVEWVFDDGTTVAQSLEQTRALQTMAIKPVKTSTIRLRLVEVSAPGRGRSARNYTAISDVSVTGTPA